MRDGLGVMLVIIKVKQEHTTQNLLNCLPSLRPLPHISPDTSSPSKLFWGPLPVLTPTHL